MSCHDAQSLLSDYALGLLDVSQRSELDHHLAAGCPTCQRELAEMNDTLSLLVESESLVSPRAELKASILDRIDAAQVTVGEASDRTSLPREQRSASWQWLAAGLAAVAIGVGAYNWGAGDWVASKGGASDASDVQRLAMEQWQRRVDGTEREFGLVGTTLVSLPLSRVEQGSVSYVLVDQVANQLHVWTKPFASDDPSAPNWVWVLDPQDQVLGRAALEPKGDCLGAVIDTKGVGNPARCRLLLTQEAIPPGSQPSEDVIDAAAFEIP